MTRYLTYVTQNGVGFVAWASEASHAEMSLAMKAQRVLSAGFIQLMPSGELHCDGESVSLAVASRPEDSRLANNLFRGEP